MAKRQEPLKVSSKTRVIEIPRVKGKSYPRTNAARQASTEAVNRTVEFLMGVGFDRESALLSIAAQLHESLVAVKLYHDNKKAEKKGGK
jgi:hypothetical protein